jgi:hemerythrin
MGLFDWIFKRKKEDLHLEWEEKYFTGIIEIDAQHRNLFSLYNSLVSAIYKGEGLVLLKQSLAELLDYAVMHFATEEAYLKKYSYPAFTQHEKEHKELREKTYFLCKDFEAGKPVLTIDLLDFLKKWLQHHVIVVDMEYRDFLRSKLPGEYLS